MEIVKRKIGELKNKIIQGDTLTELKKLPNEFIDLIITSPPYYESNLTIQ